MIANSNEENTVIPPGSTIGILGSGQLGRMTAIAAKQMGYRVHVFSPSHDSPAGQVADLEIQAAYEDLPAVARFARNVDVITLEFENIPLETLETAARLAPVRPGAKVLAVTQNRVLEKNFLADHDIPTCRYRAVRTLEELRSACRDIMPGILKTATEGYDGKGQVRIHSEAEIESAWQQLQTENAILEEYVDFEFEFSIIGARNPAGSFTAFRSIRNEHCNHILDLSVSPSGLSQELNLQATKIVYSIMDQLAAVGVLCVEFFLDRQGRILVNEIAPRPHNSGHLTVDSHLTSQFEQQVRAICGLMLGSTRQLAPAAMANILGEAWQLEDPNWHLGASMPSVKLHLYGKEIPEPGRKMGHMTAIAHSPEQALQHAVAARRLLGFFSPAKVLNDRKFAGLA